MSHTTHRNGQVITLNLGDRLIAEDGCTAVELTEHGLAGLVYIGHQPKTGRDQWLMLNSRHATVEAAYQAADFGWDQVQDCDRIDPAGEIVV